MKTLRIILAVFVFCFGLNFSYAQDTKQSKTEVSADTKTETKTTGKQTRAERRAARRAARTAASTTAHVKHTAHNTKVKQPNPTRSHNAENNLRRSRRHL